jgi:prophage regulatory protein
MTMSAAPTSRIDPAGLYRLRSIVRSKGGGLPLIDVSPSTWWLGVKTGRFPAPVRDGSMTFWRGADLLALVEGLATGRAG